jgi:hypothetical protein
LWKYVIGAALCAPGVAWVIGHYFVRGRGFPIYISKHRSSRSLFIVVSRNLNLLFFSSSNVKFIFATRLLSSFSRLCMLVLPSL